MKGKVQAMSGAGLLVVATLCLCLLLALLTVCLLTLRGDTIPTQLETIVGGLLVGVPALLAKTYRDAQPEPDAPTPVEVTNAPLETRETEAATPVDAVPSTGAGQLERSWSPADGEVTTEMPLVAPAPVTARRKRS